MIHLQQQTEYPAEYPERLIEKSKSFCTRSICDQAAELSDNPYVEQRKPTRLSLPSLLPLPEDQVSTISGISKLDEWELLEKYDIYRGVQEAKERARHKSESRNIIKAELDK